MDYWNLYKDVWNFHKKYSNARADDAYWEAVVRESARIAEKYGKERFALDLLLAVTEELERAAASKGRSPGGGAAKAGK